MTSSAATLKNVLHRADVVLLDFDGPICQVFAGMPAARVADHLRQSFAATHGTDTASQLAAGHDPLTIVRDASLRGLPGAQQLEAALTELEVQAVRTAKPTPGAAEAIHALRHGGHRLAAVSNNSTRALSRYFTDHELDRLVTLLVGREPERVARMKPDPLMLELTLGALQAAPDRAAMVGDSVTDIQAAKAAGTLSIGFANKPGKAEALQRAGADVVITDMAQLIQQGE